MNALVLAHRKLAQHIATFSGSQKTMEDYKKDLLELTKEELVDMLLKHIKTKDVKIEDVAKAILEDPDCAWLDYSQIAEAICNAFPTAKTSNKSLASYASKNPTEKGWNVARRKTTAERNAELAKLIKG